MAGRAGWSWQHGDVHVLFSGRRGGSSCGAWSSCNVGGHVGDDADAVHANRALLAARAGLDPARVAAVDQVHGADVWLDLGQGADALSPDVTWAAERPAVMADALVSSRPNVALAVAVADCAPVALCWGEAIGMVHAGWRSIVGGVLEASMAALRRAAGPVVSMPDPPRAVVGPHIGACCFEVGEDVAARFGPRSVLRSGSERPRVSLLVAIRARLEVLGVVVDTVGPCTSCEPELCFSHRRDGAPTGRQCGMVWRVG